MQEKPELAASVRKKLGEIRQCWAELESTTQAKARQLFEASKADQLVQSFAELDKKLLHMESQLQDVDPGGDLATVNSQLKKLQVWPGWPRWGPSMPQWGLSQDQTSLEIFRTGGVYSKCVKRPGNRMGIWGKSSQ